ncbi:MAG: trifunctional transcriptional activator/DNA repair protein Ada/methylated-DNA--[protein]-cysteine S-methyltransferase [Candidatus Dojkabacteria bacterium]
MNLTDKQKYQALLDKDSTFEGLFYVGVKTTGIFCRPSCTARKPKFENVEFFDTTRESLAAGYRPCKVCKPLDLKHKTPDYIKTILNEISENPSIKIKDYDLVKKGIEPNKVRRWFKSNHGITFQGYQRMIRINNAYTKLAKGAKIINAAFDSGFDSLSGFNDAFKSVLDDVPSNSKYTNVINISRFSTPLGPMFACATEDGICLLEFTERRMLEREFKDLSKRLKAKIIYGNNKYLDLVEKEVNEYFEGKRKTFDIPLVSPGSDFQNSVWNQLKAIPYGLTRSYKEQAIAINNPKAVRAVATSNGMNRIAIIIPCHRVVGSDGSLTGYAGGIWRKEWLLNFEKSNTN